MEERDHNKVTIYLFLINVTVYFSPCQRCIAVIKDARANGSNGAAETNQG